ncbi:2TM domain-containing protein [Hymenobacter sp. DH14]|uniref:2TM domain-containing protein n=1 Tax=Hymenobacter cyanobacteriorum TaxID=2926463 RepID=A0A9X2AK16_9BACT|nr:2TM domain-containing protein [Hymenobacter cyanobacteriorum]MCI1189474.1 2TM domain-containing protein [Hymenobacter cyanobacteriorum]
MEPLQRDPYLWQKAKARAKFQAHLLSFLFVNATLWVIWAFTSSHHYGHHFHVGIPWPLWVTFFWGLGLIKRGIAAYGGFTYEQRAQREYDRLTREFTDPLDKYR